MDYQIYENYTGVKIDHLTSNLFRLKEQVDAARLHVRVPREMFPPGISEEEIMKAVENCVQNQKDELLKILKKDRVSYSEK